MTEAKGILMILSPAKTLDLSPCNVDANKTTIPDCDEDKTRQIIEEMKKRKEGELGKLLGVSANLARTAHEVSVIAVSMVRGVSHPFFE